ncbi:2-succinyl-5-enolpyruvyl-6-hydroxy-3-cyclohexene-1-carboxylic-acid synthase [Staphylococcus simulans]|uniref:2-succinyl-5-enolpyruvyl-6-hydroxy-3- cyclohexene-1-carboxylic-acid synthase n=1 Tax=Staphylococcus simulans TaxID=1286 RepID=UPI000D028399|nr:2-succinyl-5-enolpyruvyl-6-hydroxy-3-cyclohexene-1-carboxylic-acid synthase [Staphylococcus simulans]AVO02644.1 2-succinyl-5-enolpyruvyl-6-hydroxy-3-cyclohexene-1-carboxylic-acid synthase [Staphylococcus simulans]AVO05589.1 2-succinyl-5-enolpyruvyl-6-hydroxy-3-cyclohexene-1-carboxylic-acid synthase [Staphylococcus simulans]AWG19191.1 2-succinyl-5-enolpyruvyl-6-hydroxy-3-cyclohexene-1-carboxylic-acid synthase [Staphylococcus simulans]AWI02140.1 2-succinyl-5-enolpyruvyl-6-hydroxy-3-cyclohexene
MDNHQTLLTKQVFTLASEIYAYGIREVVISPGSRSTPLALAFEAHPGIKTWIHPDERSASFFALGLIKGSNRPVAILCTSGTAATNYTSAVAESDISNLPLVVLTSDRPHELRGIGAPQTLNQVNMFQNFVRHQFDMPLADDTTGSTEDVIRFQMQIASQYFEGPKRGPVHFNLPFREPLTPDFEMTEWLTTNEKVIPKYQKTATVEAIKPILKKKRGFVIVGDMQHQDVRELLPFATVHDLPILAGPLSGLRQSGHPNIISTYDLLFRAGLDPKDIDFVIRVGKPVLSKKLNQWLKAADAYQIAVQNSAQPDAFPTPADITFEMTPNDFFRTLGDIPTAYRKRWLSQWQDMDSRAKIEVKNYIDHATDEAANVGILLDKLTKEDALFVSNSMPIRDVDNLFVNSEAEIYANRGANGIDGVVSTAIGMAVHKKVTLLIGDLAFYHDMNGLLMAKLNDIHLNIVLLNNDGGGIFSYLPQKESAAKYFERLFGTPTHLEFKHAAMLYDFNYALMDSVEDFKFTPLSQLESYIYEIRTDREDNRQQHQILYQKLSDIANVEL